MSSPPHKTQKSGEMGPPLPPTETAAATGSSHVKEGSGDSIGSQGSPLTSAEATPKSLDKPTLPHLQPPSAEEAKWYYCSFPSQPRLLGRTSSGVMPWVRTYFDPTVFDTGYCTVLTTATMAPIGEHPIRAIWEQVAPFIKKALQPVDWTSIDVLRIGTSHDRSPSSEPVVVWVGVGNATTPWPVIAGVLRHVRNVLDRFQLHDVECEMRESTVIALAGGPQLLDPPRRGHRNQFAIQPISTSIGQAIAPTSHRDVEGTLCLYLQPSGLADPPLWGLTCHHVALPQDEFPVSETYRGPNDSSSSSSSSSKAMEILLPTDEVLKDATRLVEEHIREDEEYLAQETSEIQRQVEQKKLNDAKALLTTLHAMGPDASRSIGHVVTASPIDVGQIQLGSEDFARTFTRDWAIIELDRAKFPGGRPYNMVDLNNNEHRISTIHSFENVVNDLIISNEDKFIFPDRGLMRLDRVIPLREIAGPPKTALDLAKEKCHILIKRGCSTGVTLGTTSEILSITRRCNDGREFETREWAVMSIYGKMLDHFSDKGDSGAVVFDTRGRIGGMIIGGTGTQERAVLGADITYVTPMSLLLADIQATMGVQVELL